MKRIFSILLTISMLLSFGVTVAGESVSNVTPTLSAETVNVGDEVVVTINNTLMNVEGFGIFLEFDSELLECVKITGVDGDEFLGLYKTSGKSLWTGATIGDSVDDTNKDGIFSFGIGAVSNVEYAAGVVAELHFIAKASGTVEFVLNEDTTGTNAFKGIAAKKSVEIIAPHTCEFTKEVAEEKYLAEKATCTTNTTYYKSCICGEKGTETFEKIDTALGHDYTEKVEDEAHLKETAADCTKYDTYWYDCSRCDANAKDDIEATDKYFTSEAAGDHKFTKKVADDAHRVVGTGTDCQSKIEYYYGCEYCDAISTTDTWISETVGNHSVSTEWTTVDGKHYHACTVEGCTYKEDEAPCDGGTATCVAKAVCKDCGKSYGELADHNYGELVSAQEEVHTKTELKPAVAAHYYCGICEKYFDEEKKETTLDKLTGDTPEHTYGDLEALDATHHGYICSVATCGLIKGQAEHKYDNDADMRCNDCDYDRSCKHPDNKKTVHDAVASTCKTPGNAKYVFCEECKTVIEGSDAELPLNPGNHEKGLTEKEDAKYIKSAADCINNAVYYKSYECCGAVAGENETFVKNGSALGHSYTVRKYDAENHWYKCERCDSTYGVEKHYGGTATCIALAVCTADGCGQSYGELADHSFAKKYSKDENYHWKDCSVKGCEEKTEVAEHVYDDDADMVCNTCKYDRSCKHEADKREHIPAVAPKCNEAGMKEYWLCECGVKFDAEEDGNEVKDADLVIAALGHDMADATCTEPRTCQRLGCGYTEGDPLGHDMADATCTKPSTCKRGCGYTEGTALGHTDQNKDEICDVCEEDIHEHAYDTEVWKSDENGHWNECACGEKANSGKHMKSSWIIDTEATDTTEGSRHIECVVCGYIMETEAIPVLKPSFTNEAWYYQMLYLVNRKFTITAGAGEGGSITDEGTTVVKYNTSKKYVITPDEGYEIKSVIVNGKDVGAVPEYNFRSIKSNQTIHVIFEKIAATSPFVDVSVDAPYFDAVLYVYNNGIINGVSETEMVFAPDTTMTRAMFVTVLGRMSGVNMADYPVVTFADCEAGSWYAPYVEWAAQAGIVKGYSAETFGPMDEITVEQAAVILYRYIAYMGYNTAADADLANYADGAQVSEWAAEQMKWALANNIYVSDTTLDPQAPAARSLVAEMLYNLSVWMG